MSSYVEKVGGEDQGDVSSIRKVAMASAIGATVEWYDFFLYGTAAGLVFGQLFFPTFDPRVGTLVAFLTGVAGFAARPIGGIIFGHFGDRVGRKTMLVITILMMGVATFLMGLLPTYAQIGIWAPILLLTLRVLQGIALGGEYGGAVLMTAEHAPEERRGFYTSWVQVGAPAGLCLGTLVFTLLSLLPDEQFLAWGWRVAFLLSVVLVAIGLYIRLQITESPAFAEVRETQTEVKVPFFEMLRTAPKEILIGMGLRLTEGVTFNIYGVWVIAYATGELGMSRTTVLLAVLIGAAIAVPFVPVWGAVTDRIGRRAVVAMGALAFGLWAIPSMLLIDSRSIVGMYIAIIVAFGLIYPLAYAPVAAIWAELFPTRIRYTGVSFTYQFTGILTGLTPVIATALIGTGGGGSLAVGYYLIGIIIITLVCCALLRPHLIKEMRPTGTGRQPARAEG